MGHSSDNACCDTSVTGDAAGDAAGDATIATSCCDADAGANRPVRLWPRWLPRDRVINALLLGVLALALYDTAQAAASLQFTAAALWRMLPFFALALLIAAYVRASGADAPVARAFSGHPLKAVVAAALVGAISPFCSCTVIPLIAALLASGVPLAPVMAFWIASPVMDPEMFVLTAAGIGTGFAAAKTLAAIGMALLAGGAAWLLQSAGQLGQPLRTGGVATGSCCASSTGGDGGGCGTAALASAPRWAFWREPARRRLFRDEARDNALFLGKWLAVAFFLESLMLAWVPAEQVGALVGGDAWYAIPLAALVGAPAYLNGYAAIPLVDGLLEMGMAPGAAMAFITTGAVSSIPAAVAVYALVRRAVFATYLVLGLLGAMLSGLVYGWFVAL